MEQQTKRENFVAGVVGAVLGSFLGAVCIILVSQLGYVAVISGMVMGVCTLKGYELLGGTLSRKGIVVSLALVLGMTWLAFQMDCAIEVAREAEIDFFEAFRSIGYLLEEEYLNPSYYWGNLIVLYLFTLPGAVPLILGARKAPEEEAVPPYASSAAAPGQPGAACQFYTAEPRWMRRYRVSIFLPLFVVLGFVFGALLYTAAQGNEWGPLMGCVAMVAGLILLLSAAVQMAQPTLAGRWLYVRGGGALWRVDFQLLNLILEFRFTNKRGTVRVLQWGHLSEEEQRAGREAIERAIQQLTAGQLPPGSALSRAVTCLADPQLEKETPWFWKISYRVRGGGTEPERRKKLVIAKAYPGLAPAPGTTPPDKAAPGRWGFGLAAIALTAALFFVPYTLLASPAAGPAVYRPYVGEGFTVQIDETWESDGADGFVKGDDEYYRIIATPLGSYTPEETYHDLRDIWAEGCLPLEDPMYPSLWALSDGVTEEGDDYQFFFQEWEIDQDFYGCLSAIMSVDKNLLISIHGYTTSLKKYHQVAAEVAGVLNSVTFQIGQEDALSGRSFLCGDGSQLNLDPDGSFLWVQTPEAEASARYLGSYEVFYGQEAVEEIASREEYGLTRADLWGSIFYSMDGYWPDGAPLEGGYTTLAFGSEETGYYVCLDTFYVIVLHNESLVHEDGSAEPMGYDTVYLGFYIPELELADLINLNTATDARWYLQE